METKMYSSFFDSRSLVIRSFCTNYYGWIQTQFNASLSFEIYYLTFIIKSSFYKTYKSKEKKENKPINSSTFLNMKFRIDPIRRSRLRLLGLKSLLTKHVCYPNENNAARVRVRFLLLLTL